MTTKLLLITQGVVGERLFRKLLEPEFGQQVQVRTSERFMEAVGQARSALLRGQWVMLVPGSESRQRDEIWEQRGFMEFYLSIGFRGQWRSVLLVPEVEVLLFHEPSIPRQLLGREPTEEELARGRKRPRRVLGELLGLKDKALSEELCRRLETVDLSPLEMHRAVRKARVFFRNRLREFAREAARAATRPGWRPGGSPPGAGAG